MTDTKLLFEKMGKAEKEFYLTLDELLQLAAELSPNSQVSQVTSQGDNNVKPKRKQKKKSRARKRARLSTSNRGVV